MIINTSINIINNPQVKLLDLLGILQSYKTTIVFEIQRLLKVTYIFSEVSKLVKSEKEIEVYIELANVLNLHEAVVKDLEDLYRRYIEYTKNYKKYLKSPYYIFAAISTRLDGHSVDGFICLNKQELRDSAFKHNRDISGVLLRARVQNGKVVQFTSNYRMDLQDLQDYISAFSLKELNDFISTNLYKPK